MSILVLATENSVGVCLLMLGLVVFFFFPNRLASYQNVGLEGNSVLCFVCSAYLKASSG